ncbi:MAG: hypothetical protein Q8L51_01900 [Candidatus Amesbacteria bacterium]|nr:hypothetical protein [Candidatus Amesbacteria bacterium]
MNYPTNDEKPTASSSIRASAPFSIKYSDDNTSLVVTIPNSILITSSSKAGKVLINNSPRTTPHTVDKNTRYYEILSSDNLVVQVDGQTLSPDEYTFVPGRAVTIPISKILSNGNIAPNGIGELVLSTPAPLLPSDQQTEINKILDATSRTNLENHSTYSEIFIIRLKDSDFYKNYPEYLNNIPDLLQNATYPKNINKAEIIDKYSPTLTSQQNGQNLLIDILNWIKNNPVETITSVLTIIMAGLAFVITTAISTPILAVGLTISLVSAVILLYNAQKIFEGSSTFRTRIWFIVSILVLISGAIIFAVGALNYKTSITPTPLAPKSATVAPTATLKAPGTLVPIKSAPTLIPTVVLNQVSDAILKEELKDTICFGDSLCGGFSLVRNTWTYSGLGAGDLRQEFDKKKNTFGNAKVIIITAGTNNPLPGDIDHIKHMVSESKKLGLKVIILVPSYYEIGLTKQPLTENAKKALKTTIAEIKNLENENTIPITYTPDLDVVHATEKNYKNNIYPQVLAAVRNWNKSQPVPTQVKLPVKPIVYDTKIYQGNPAMNINGKEAIILGGSNVSIGNDTQSFGVTRSLPSRLGIDSAHMIGATPAEIVALINNSSTFREDAQKGIYGSVIILFEGTVEENGSKLVEVDLDSALKFLEKYGVKVFGITAFEQKDLNSARGAARKIVIDHNNDLLRNAFKNKPGQLLDLNKIVDDPNGILKRDNIDIGKDSDNVGQHFRDPGLAKVANMILKMYSEYKTKYKVSTTEDNLKITGNILTNGLGLIYNYLNPPAATTIVDNTVYDNQLTPKSVIVTSPARQSKPVLPGKKIDLLKRIKDGNWVIGGGSLGILDKIDLSFLTTPEVAIAVASGVGLIALGWLAVRLGWLTKIKTKFASYNKKILIFVILGGIVLGILGFIAWPIIMAGGLSGLGAGVGGAGTAPLAAMVGLVKSDKNVGIASKASKDHPNTNEDSSFVVGPFAGVFDGVSTVKGSEKASAQARKQAIENIDAYIEKFGLERINNLTETEARKLIVKILSGINKKLVAGKFGATTASIAYLGNGFVVTGNVGDSRVYAHFLNKDNNKQYIKRLTKDNNYIYNYLQENFDKLTANKEFDKIMDDLANSEDISGVIRNFPGISKVVEYVIQRNPGMSREDALIELTNTVTKVLGNTEDVEIDMRVITIGNNVILQRLGIFTDGIHDNLTEQKISEIMESKVSNQYIADALVKAAVEKSNSSSQRRKRDDMTAVVIDFTKENDTGTGFGNNYAGAISGFGSGLGASLDPAIVHLLSQNSTYIANYLNIYFPNIVIAWNNLTTFNIGQIWEGVGKNLAPMAIVISIVGSVGLLIEAIKSNWLAKYNFNRKFVIIAILGGIVLGIVGWLGIIGLSGLGAGVGGAGTAPLAAIWSLFPEKSSLQIRQAPKTIKIKTAEELPIIEIKRSETKYLALNNDTSLLGSTVELSEYRLTIDGNPRKVIIKEPRHDNYIDSGLDEKEGIYQDAIYAELSSQMGVAPVFYGIVKFDDGVWGYAIDMIDGSDISEKKSTYVTSQTVSDIWDIFARAWNYQYLPGGDSQFMVTKRGRAFVTDVVSFSGNTRIITPSNKIYNTDDSIRTLMKQINFVKMSNNKIKINDYKYGLKLAKDLAFPISGKYLVSGSRYLERNSLYRDDRFNTEVDSLKLGTIITDPEGTRWQKTAKGLWFIIDKPRREALFVIDQYKKLGIAIENYNQETQVQKLNSVNPMTLGVLMSTPWGMSKGFRWALSVLPNDNWLKINVYPVVKAIDNILWFPLHSAGYLILNYLPGNLLPEVKNWLWEEGGVRWIGDFWNNNFTNSGKFNLTQDEKAPVLSGNPSALGQKWYEFVKLPFKIVGIVGFDDKIRWPSLSMMFGYLILLIQGVSNFYSNFEIQLIKYIYEPFPVIQSYLTHLFLGFQASFEYPTFIFKEISTLSLPAWLTPISTLILTLIQNILIQASSNPIGAIYPTLVLIALVFVIPISIVHITRVLITLMEASIKHVKTGNLSKRNFLIWSAALALSSFVVYKSPFLVKIPEISPETVDVAIKLAVENPRLLENAMEKEANNIYYQLQKDNKYNFQPNKSYKTLTAQIKDAVTMYGENNVYYSQDQTKLKRSDFVKIANNYLAQPNQTPLMFLKDNIPPELFDIAIGVGGNDTGVSGLFMSKNSGFYRRLTKPVKLEQLSQQYKQEIKSLVDYINNEFEISGQKVSLSKIIAFYLRKNQGDLRLALVDTGLALEQITRNDVVNFSGMNTGFLQSASLSNIELLLKIEDPFGKIGNYHDITQQVNPAKEDSNWYNQDSNLSILNQVGDIYHSMQIAMLLSSFTPEFIHLSIIYHNLDETYSKQGILKAAKDYDAGAQLIEVNTYLETLPKEKPLFKSQNPCAKGMNIIPSVYAAESGFEDPCPLFSMQNLNYQLGRVTETVKGWFSPPPPPPTPIRDGESQDFTIKDIKYFCTGTKDEFGNDLLGTESTIVMNLPDGETHTVIDKDVYYCDKGFRLTCSEGKCVQNTNLHLNQVRIFITLRDEYGNETDTSLIPNLRLLAGLYPDENGNITYDMGEIIELSASYFLNPESSDEINIPLTIDRSKLTQMYYGADDDTMGGNGYRLTLRVPKGLKLKNDYSWKYDIDTSDYIKQVEKRNKIYIQGNWDERSLMLLDYALMDLPQDMYNYRIFQSYKKQSQMPCPGIACASTYDIPHVSFNTSLSISKLTVWHELAHSYSNNKGLNALLPHNYNDRVLKTIVDSTGFYFDSTMNKWILPPTSPVLDLPKPNSLECDLSNTNCNKFDKYQFTNPQEMLAVWAENYVSDSADFCDSLPSYCYIMKDLFQNREYKNGEWINKLQPHKND